MLDYDVEKCPYSIGNYEDYSLCGYSCLEEINGKKTERYGSECKPTLSCLKYLKYAQCQLDDFELM